jgi:hypothetical protein
MSGLPVVPIRIYFNDGRIVDYEDGVSKFCKEFPQYHRNAIIRMQKGKETPYKDIMKVEVLDGTQDINPQPMYGVERKTKTLPFRVYFKDGRVEEFYQGKPEFCEKYSHMNYDRELIRRVQTGERNYHKDIIKVELI